MGSAVFTLGGLLRQAKGTAAVIPSEADARDTAALDEILRGELTTNEHKVPAMAVLLFICSSITLVNYLGHTELFTVLDAAKPMTIRVVMGISLLLLVAQAITVDWCIVRSYPRIGLYMRRFRRDWPMFFEYLFYFIIGGGTEAYTYVGVIYSLDSNASALFSSAPLIDPASPQFKVQIGLRGVLFFWTIVQIILLNEDIRTDMVTLRETFARRWGNFCMNIVAMADPRRVSKGAAFRTFQAAVSDTDDEEFVKKIELLDKDEFDRLKQEGRNEALATFDSMRADLEQQHSIVVATLQANQDELRAEISTHQDRISTIFDALRTATSAILAHEPVPDDAVEIVPELRYLA